MSDDDWIVVRRELTVGQEREMYRAMRRPDGPGLDLAEFPRQRALAYIVAWSFVDLNGAAAPVSAGAIDFLETATFNEIVAALNDHEAAIEQEKKRMTTGPIASDPTLLSVG